MSGKYSSIYADDGAIAALQQLSDDGAMIDGGVDWAGIALERIAERDAEIDALRQERSRLVDRMERVIAVREREVQALHAGISRRDWWATEKAANELRDKIDALLSTRTEASA